MDILKRVPQMSESLCGDKMRKPRKSTQSEFAKNLTNIMKERGITVRSAAKLAGVGPSTIDNWRSGAAPENFLAVKKLAKELGISFSALLTGEAEHETKPSITEIFDDRGLWFDGYAHVTIRRLEEKKRR